MATILGGDLVYSQQGIQRLALVLRSFARLQGWGDLSRGYADVSGISVGTASRYLNGQVVRCKTSTLQAFAKVVYRVVAIEGDRVLFDDASVYGEDWISLAKLATDDPDLGQQQADQDDQGDHQI